MCDLHIFFTKYNVFSKMSSSSTGIHLNSQDNTAAFLTLELSTESIQTIEQVPAYPLQGFFGDIGGNIGILFGFSIMNLKLAYYGNRKIL